MSCSRLLEPGGSVQTTSANCWARPSTRRVIAGQKACSLRRGSTRESATPQTGRAVSVRRLLNGMVMSTTKPSGVRSPTAFPHRIEAIVIVSALAQARVGLHAQGVDREQVAALAVVKRVEQDQHLIVLLNLVALTEAGADRIRLSIAAAERDVQRPAVAREKRGRRLGDRLAVVRIALDEAIDDELALRRRAVPVVGEAWRPGDGGHLHGGRGRRAAGGGQGGRRDDSGV